MLNKQCKYKMCHDSSKCTVILSVMYDSNIVIHEASRTESPTMIPFSHEASTRSGLGYIFDDSDCTI
ncbi:hypothetical protein T11_9623 [Trichinella zimbabwensis]|uniref:Uncharacterized protein n=1 Tax=Trichinella zimbabwensis TaxID=268475 RepID=A0A0V1HDP0_9BILA|nr:hypothetical protein T11_9623 [Trichinella zimbabwensis]